MRDHSQPFCPTSRTTRSLAWQKRCEWECPLLGGEGWVRGPTRHVGSIAQPTPIANMRTWHGFLPGHSQFPWMVPDRGRRQSAFIFVTDFTLFGEFLAPCPTARRTGSRDGNFSATDEYLCLDGRSPCNHQSLLSRQLGRGTSLAISCGDFGSQVVGDTWCLA